MEASRTAISREQAAESQRKLIFGTGRTGEARSAAAEAPEARAARADLNAQRSFAASSAEPPDTDPYVRWCGRGGAVRLPPIPIADGHIGPLAVTQRTALGAAFRTALKLAAESDSPQVSEFLPGSCEAALSTAVEYGMRITIPMVLMSTHDFGDWARYLPRNPGFM